jgi:hypothetical protein
MNEGATNNTSKTDWSKVDAMTDDDIDTSDIPPWTRSFLRKQRCGCLNLRFRVYLNLASS